METTELTYHEKFTAYELETEADKIMYRFNFEDVLKHMEATDWKWFTDNEMKTPTIEDLRTTARMLLTTVIWNEKHVSHCGTGGFNAYKMPWGLKLEFVLVWS